MMTNFDEFDDGITSMKSYMDNTFVVQNGDVWKFLK